MPLFKFKNHDPVISIHKTRLEEDEFADFTNYSEEFLIADEETFGQDSVNHQMSGEVYFQSRKIENIEKRKNFILKCLQQDIHQNQDARSRYAQSELKKNFPLNWHKDESDPNQHPLKYRVQLEVIRKKCEQNSAFKEKLLATKGLPIFEDTSGIGYYDNDFGMGPTGTGKNYLGLALMTVREELLETQDLKTVVEALNDKARAVAKEIIPLKTQLSATYNAPSYLPNGHEHKGQTFYKRDEINQFQNSDFKIISFETYQKFQTLKPSDLGTKDSTVPYKKVLSALQQLAEVPETDENNVIFGLRGDSEWSYVVTLKEVNPSPNTAVTVDNEFLSNMRKQKDLPKNTNDIGMIEEYLRESSVKYLTALKNANDGFVLEVFAHQKSGEPDWYFELKKKALEQAKQECQITPVVVASGTSGPVEPLTITKTPVTPVTSADAETLTVKKYNNKQ